MLTKLTILGGGESGLGAALLAKQKGYDVFLSDSSMLSEKAKEELHTHEISFEEGFHSIGKILQASIIIKSPGIPEKSLVLQAIRNSGIEVISEIEFAYRYKGDSKIIAITGTNGKTTTTSMLAHMYATADKDYALAGNIGYSFARQIAQEPKETYILEISSFQLDDIKSFRPNVSVITNITEDHLDRYNYNFEKYIASKFRIIANQTADDIFIYNADDPVTTKYLNQFINQVKALPVSMNKQLPTGAYIENAEMHIKWRQEEMKMSIEDFKVKGKQNQYNTMVAALSANVMGLRKERIRTSIETMESLEHRMQPVGTIRGVEFINDSKSTNTNCVWYALESMTKPAILIMGGVDKGNDYAFLKDLVEEKVKAIVCLAKDTVKLHDAFEGLVPMVDASSAREAVETAFAMAEKGDVVLLSPGCASFDLFENFEDRGFQFIEAVKQL